MINMKTIGVAMTIVALSHSGPAVAEEDQASAKPHSEGAILLFAGAPNPAEIAAFREYSQGSAALFREAGVKPLGRFATTEKLIGECDIAFVNYALFPSVEVAQNLLFEAEPYQALMPARRKAFSSLNIYLAEAGSVPAQLAPEKATNITIAKPRSGEEAALREYQKGARQLAREHGLTPVANFKIKEQVHGDCEADFIAIAQSERHGQVSDMIASAEYGSVVPARDRAFEAVNLLLVEAR